MDFDAGVRERCRGLSGKIGLPESLDDRTLSAAHQLLSDDIIDQVTLFADAEAAWAVCDKHKIALKRHAKRIAWHPAPPDQALTAAGELLAKKQIDAVVAGAVHTTANVIRAVLSTVGLAPGCRTVSGCFMLHRTNPVTRAPEVMLFADSGVVIDPNGRQLLDIAKSSVDTWRCIMGPDHPPVVAFLSFSTAGSAQHDNVTKMSEAVKQFKEKYPDIAADGEMQFDAAYDASVGARKFPGSKVPGKANCFIFPNLDAGNIAYKMAQRLGGFAAYGPILQGAALPYSDLSRGATAHDIVMSAYINLLRAKVPLNN